MIACLNLVPNGLSPLASSDSNSSKFFNCRASSCYEKCFPMRFPPNPYHRKQAPNTGASRSLPTRYDSPVTLTWLLSFLPRAVFFLLRRRFGISSFRHSRNSPSWISRLWREGGKRYIYGTVGDCILFAGQLHHFALADDQGNPDVGLDDGDAVLTSSSQHR